MATKYDKKSQDKVERAMHEMKRGELKSGRSGKTVKDRDQAIAIGLSEARKEGSKAPKKAKTSSSSKAGGRKSATKASASKKSSSRSSATKSHKTTARKSTTSHRRTKQPATLAEEAINAIKRMAKMVTDNVESAAATAIDYIEDEAKVVTRRVKKALK